MEKGASRDCSKPLEGPAVQNALAERIKELNCLYGISNLFENQDVSLSWIMQRAVELIPAAWQYPENACARIKIEGKEYASGNFKETPYRQNAEIVLNDRHVGDVDVLVYELILKAAATDASVAVFGESGSGKELVAHAIHTHSDRKDKRFVAVNCGAIQESLFEREFFGHRKGAFSSAHSDSPGYLDMADGGTLFLDEVGELTPNMQAKLLRAIEGGGYRPVGGTETESGNFRIISASNSVLGDKVAGGHMRIDFFYRIQVLQIQLPPLRERKEDIPLLVEHFWGKMKAPSGITRISGRTMDILMEYDWPGNVRELRNVLQRYATLGRLEFLSPGAKASSAQVASGVNLREAVRELEKSLVKKAMDRAGGNKTEAAKLLGISRRALFRKMAMS